MPELLGESTAARLLSKPSFPAIFGARWPVACQGTHPATSPLLSINSVKLGIQDHPVSTLRERAGMSRKLLILDIPARSLRVETG